MLLRVVHSTGFSYDDVVQSSYNEARMSPTTSSAQMVLHSRVDVFPKPWTSTYQDYWGTQVTAFEVHEAHTELQVTSISTVEVDRPVAKVAALSWDDIGSDQVRDSNCEMLMLSQRVAPEGGFADTVEELTRQSPSPSDLALSLCDLVHERLAYVTGSTEVSTRACDAWNAGSGVCQDFAHLVIGGLRSQGIPARYVSGYLHPDPDPQVGDTVVGESHAWVEWWDGEWIGYDPTNAAVPRDRHVVIARGRDYGDVPPLSGIFSGGGTTSSMFVGVEVTRLR